MRNQIVTVVFFLVFIFSNVQAQNNFWKDEEIKQTWFEDSLGLENQRISIELPEFSKCLGLHTDEVVKELGVPYQIVDDSWKYIIQARRNTDGTLLPLVMLNLYFMDGFVFDVSFNVH